MKLLMLFLLSVLAARGAEGQCFIATQGGSNVKLGGVEISLVAETTIAAFLQREGPAHREKLGAIHKESDRIRGIMRTLADKTDLVLKGYERLAALDAQRHAAYHSHYSAMAKAARPSARTHTDADGRFTLDSDTAAAVYIFARTQRLVGKKTEHYVWLVPAAEFQPPFLLSNHNLRLRWTTP